MTRYVALFRGINVGGKHIVPMKELREALAELGCEDVQTYIQSGNAVFSSGAKSEKLSAQIAGVVNEFFGFEPQVLVLSADRFRALAAANPFATRATEPRFIHVAFLTDEPANADLDALKGLQSPTEEFELRDGAFYLHAPDGIARSKLVEKIDRCLGVSTTSRNWRTVTKLVSML